MCSLKGDYSWSAAFHRFYGLDYCLRISMDLERLHDQQYQGSHFRFQEGWVVPTVDLLTRLRAFGLPLRTKDHIIVHLCPPVETMSAGEFYLQVGRQLPGRLSLKFTRRNADGAVVIQPTVLEVEEERQLGSNPCRYIDGLREAARLSHSDGQKILSTIILMSTRCETLRLHATSFLQRLNEMTDEWTPGFPPVNNEIATHSSLPVACADAVRQRRSGSDGNISTRSALHSAGEPEENDETNQIKNPPTSPQKPNPQRSSLVDEYTGVDQGINAFRRKSSGGSSTGERTFLTDEYTAMTNAMASLNVQRNPSPNYPNFQYYPNYPNYPNPNQNPPQMIDEYVGTNAAVAPEPPVSISWTTQRSCRYLPLTVEEVNRISQAKTNHQ